MDKGKVSYSADMPNNALFGASPHIQQPQHLAHYPEPLDLADTAWPPQHHPARFGSIRLRGGKHVAVERLRVFG